MSSHIESDMDICLKKQRTICWAGALGGIARAELPSPLEQNKALLAHMVRLRHDTTLSVRVSTGCVKHGAIC